MASLFKQQPMENTITSNVGAKEMHGSKEEESDGEKLFESIQELPNQILERIRGKVGPRHVDNFYSLKDLCRGRPRESFSHENQKTNS